MGLVSPVLPLLFHNNTANISKLSNSSEWFTRARLITRIRRIIIVSTSLMLIRIIRKCSSRRNGTVTPIHSPHRRHRQRPRSGTVTLIRSPHRLHRQRPKNGTVMPIRSPLHHHNRRRSGTVAPRNRSPPRHRHLLLLSRLSHNDLSLVLSRVLSSARLLLLKRVQFNEFRSV